MKEFLAISECPMYLRFVIILSWHSVLGTIDINVNELEYLAARLNPFECRRLIAALHYTTYELPNNMAAAGTSTKIIEQCVRTVRFVFLRHNVNNCTSKKGTWTTTYLAFDTFYIGTVRPVRAKRTLTRL